MITLAIRLDRGGFTLDAAFQVPENGVTALFGRSGSGKTTIINAIAGLVRPDHGRITVGDDVLFDSASGINVPVARRRLGYVFQEGRLFPHLSVRQNLLYGHRGRSHPGTTFEETVDLLGLNALLERRPASLSGGERQRVAIGRALLADPGLLLMDEPLASLDATRRAEILPYIARLRQTLEIPVIFVSHQRDEVMQLADSVVLLSHGQVEAFGRLEEVFNHVAGQTLSGARQAGTVVSGRIGGQDPTFGLTRFDWSGGPIWIGAVDLPDGTPARIHIEARDVALALTPPEGVSVLNVIRARIREIHSDSGPHVDVHLEVSGARLLARITRRSATELGLQPGMTVHAMVKSVSLDAGSLGQTGHIIR